MAKPKDPLYAKQWHLKQLGGIDTIWDEYSGKGVKVGVFDEGVDYKHRDLKGNYNAALEFRYSGTTYDPYPIHTRGRNAEAHGTAVSGIIAASWNGTYGVGVAWGAKITGVNVLADEDIQRPAVWIAALKHQAQFDVVNNSWGYDPFFYAERNFTDPTIIVAREVEAFRYCVENGRDGLGTIIVQAAGNDGANANGDALTNIRYSISVAATGKNGLITNYSNYGPNILVAAPSASVTVDITGSKGYNSSAGSAGDTISNFNGTSASAPVTSGVVALMLEANRNLGWRDVREILAVSATIPNSAATGGTDLEVALPRFQQLLTDDSDPAGLDSDTWNDGGHYNSADYGFGKLDGYAAVRLAEVWSLIHGEARALANEQGVSVSDSSATALTTVAEGETEITVTVTEALYVENIDATLRFNFDVNNPGSETWLISLISPTGSVYRLNFTSWKAQNNGLPSGDGLSAAAGSGNGEFTWNFAVTHALGENALGEWTIRFENYAQAGSTGSYYGADIQFYGRDWGTDNVHYITRDFLKAAEVEDANAERNPETVRDGIITDLNGGTDWLVMATLAPSVNVSLTGGGAIVVGGVTWATIGNTTVIENLVTGDGADVLTGNAAVNDLYGMRGNDTISGADGDDLISGGAGADQLSGGADADSFIFKKGTGADQILDFTDDVDSLVLSDGLWAGADLTVAEVLTRFATVTDSGVLLGFGRAGSVLLNGISDVAILLDDVLIA